MKLPTTSFTARLLTVLTAGILLTTASNAQLRNPIIEGFHPDPSVCRVDSDYYLVNSSFQYFPGVPIYHSRDLVNWTQIGNVLDRDSQLPLDGATSWLGIYAPTIRYNDGTWYMITTNVGHGGNFMVTAPKPTGPWSEPIWLKQQGIDPSLYFEDGHCYMVSNPDNHIMLCEIDPKTGEKLTDSRVLWRGTGGRYPEGPHIYKKDGFYYLLISEGGTELAHRLTIARSRDIWGPYEANPANPLLTNCSMAGQGMQIQGTGHGDFVQSVDGRWWVVFLAYRNFGGSYHHLGRETCIAPVKWEKDQWPVVNDQQPIDTLLYVAPPAKQQPMKRHIHTVFNSLTLDPEWVYIQNPVMQNYQLVNGQLRLRSNGSLWLNDRPTFMGRRQEAPAMQVETEVDIHEPAGDQYGLAIYQIHDGHVRFFATADGITLDYRLKSLDGIKNADQWKNGQRPKKVRLRITSDGLKYQFWYAADSEREFRLFGQIECSLLSTEIVGGFTGVTIGMFCDVAFSERSQDSGYGVFYYFDYEEK